MKSSESRTNSKYKSPYGCRTNSHFVTVIQRYDFNPLPFQHFRSHNSTFFSLRAAVFKIDASHLEMTTCPRHRSLLRSRFLGCHAAKETIVIGTHLVHVGNLEGLFTLSPMKLLALLTNPRQ